MRAFPWLVLTLMWSCTTKPSAPPPPALAQLVPVEVAPTPTSVLPDPRLNGGHVGRAPRRLSVPQLKQSIVTVTGHQWSQIDALASSLGQADYALTVSDITDPNLVFAKFLDDGAREVCLATARDDLAAAPTDRALTPNLGPTPNDVTNPDDAALTQTLMRLSVRFWGSPFGSDEAALWATTFRKVSARASTINKPEQAWAAICVGMMTDPRFFTY